MKRLTYRHANPVLNHLKFEFNFVSRHFVEEFIHSISHLDELFYRSSLSNYIGKINWDEAVPEIMDIQAVPVKWRNSWETIQKMRLGRQQEQQQQQMIDAAPAAASAMKSIMPMAAK